MTSQSHATLTLTNEQADGRGGSPKVGELLAEISKYAAKLQVAEDLYNSQNAKIKEDVLTAKERSDDLLDGLLLSSVVCQVIVMSFLDLDRDD